MREAREEMKTALLAEAEVAIEELLDQLEGEEPTLTELEEIILELRKRLGQRMGRVIVERQEATRPVERPRCLTCGQEMSYKGMKRVTA